jgi:hypothetical protein
MDTGDKPEDKMSTDDGFKPIRLVYAGRRLTKENKLADLWINTEDQDDTALYNNCRPNHCGIGTSFEIMRSSTQIRPSSATNPQNNEDSETLAIWEANDRSAYNYFQQVKLVKRLAKDSGFQSVMEPLKRVYKKLPFSDRQCFILMIIDELKKG